ncbi:MAG: hypothetical protein ACLRSW_03020 [Christensenellaceae bacterium]
MDKKRFDEVAVYCALKSPHGFMSYGDFRNAAQKSVVIFIGANFQTPSENGLCFPSKTVFKLPLENQLLFSV